MGPARRGGAGDADHDAGYGDDAVVGAEYPRAQPVESSGGTCGVWLIRVRCERVARGRAGGGGGRNIS